MQHTAPVDVPAAVVQRAALLGAAGQAWLAGLDDLVHELERRWSFTAGAPLPGGSAACVRQVRTADGRDAVLKLEPPDPDLLTAGQIETLAAARGNGYVELLASDLEQRALLLEALGAPMTRSSLSPEQQMALLCRMLVRAWQLPRPDGATTEQAREKAGVLAQLVSTHWEDLGRPCTERVVDVVLEMAARRQAGSDLERSVVVHGDPHPGNALRAVRQRPGAEVGWVFVDPDGFLADPAYDLGVVLRGWCAELLAGSADDALSTARRWCRLLADRSGIDQTAIWEWGLLERVSSGLYLLHLGALEEGRSYLASAERLVPGG